MARGGENLAQHPQRLRTVGLKRQRLLDRLKGRREIAQGPKSIGLRHLRSDPGLNTAPARIARGLTRWVG